MARIPFANFEEAPPKIQEFFARVKKNNNGRVIDVQRLMANSPGAVREFVRLGNSLLMKGELDGRYRELAIIRLSLMIGAHYEWAHHAPIAMRTGVTKEQLENIDNWKDSSLFSEEDKAVLAFTEEVVRDSEPSEKTYAAASRFFGPTQLVELTLAIGYWSLVAKFLRTFQVKVEDWFMEEAGRDLPAYKPEA